MNLQKKRTKKSRPSFSVITLGCKVNQYESEAIAQELIASGFKMEDPTHSETSTPADTVIINTCTVTRKASMQSRQAIRKAVKSNPDATIIVTGCHAQTDPDDINRIQGVCHIIGHKDKHTIPKMMQAPAGKSAAVSSTPNSSDVEKFSFRRPLQAPLGNRTRPFLKIQDGCDSFCTYCIVPYARGRHQSMPLEDAVTSVRNINCSGFHEVVLTGIHLGCYGSDLSPSIHLSDLLRRLTRRQVIDRIRLSSIEPLEITDELIELISASASRPGHICRHFHIPMQSGDDAILKRMHRPYLQKDFRARIHKIHHTIPDAAIGVDVIFGFPGETDGAFRNTLSVIEELPLSYLHVFPFSPRKGTPASRYPNQIPAEIIKDRCRTARDLGIQKRRAFLERHIHTDIEVLVETTEDAKTGLLRGVTSNYIKVFLGGSDEIKNTFQTVKIEKVLDHQSVLGRCVQRTAV